MRDPDKSTRTGVTSVAGPVDPLGVHVQGGTVTPMAMLESGIPLSLLLDLVLGPQSADLLEHERRPGQPKPQPARTVAS